MSDILYSIRDLLSVFRFQNNDVVEFVLLRVQEKPGVAFCSIDLKP